MELSKLAGSGDCCVARVLVIWTSAPIHLLTSVAVRMCLPRQPSERPNWVPFALTLSSRG